MQVDLRDYGATSGIGQAAAMMLATKRADLVLVGRNKAAAKKCCATPPAG
jgi:short-subunit dehydrogenase